MKSKIITILTLVIAISTLSFKKPEKKILFFGDSITNAGTHGEDAYINKIGYYANQDGLNPELINAGIGGNKVTDLFLRLKSDVLDKSPDIVVVYIGINDIWHKTLQGTGVSFSKFGGFYDAIVQELLKENIKVILCTPSVIGECTDFTNQNDGDLNKYSLWIKNYADSRDIPFINLRKSFLEYNLKHNSDNVSKGILTTDGVHLNKEGNDLVAKEMWTTIKALL